jgi:hypothetical protein
MSLQQRLAHEDIEWQQSEYGDTVEFAADFGPTGHPAVDVVGDTVIVVTDDEQYEFDVEADARAVMTNGVLSIEVDR